MRVTNLGKGKLTYAVPIQTTTMIAAVDTGVVPSTITLTMDPGRSGVVRQPGTNLYTNAGTGKLMTLWLTATPAQPQRFFRVKAATPSSWVTDLVTTNVVPGQDIAVGFPETGDLP